MFQIFPDNLKIPFMSIRWPMTIVSLVAVVGSLYLVATKGLKYGVDFAGGIQLVLSFDSSVDVDAEKLRSTMADMGLEASVQNFGTQFDDVAVKVGADKGSAKGKEFIVHFSSDFVDPEANAALLRNAFQKYQEGEASVISSFRFSGMERAFFTLSRDIPLEEVEKIVKSIPFQLLELESVAVFGPERNREYEVRFREVASKIVDRIAAAFDTKAGEGIQLQKVGFVGAKVGADLKLSAIWSVLITCFLIFLYIFIRYDLKFAPGAVLALVHDVIVTIGAISLFEIEFDLTAVAALLTLAGYSINDTIVIYDRIREIIQEYKGKRMREIIDLAVNQTLSRTVITSFTVLLASGVLWIFGGPVIYSFAFALTVGVIVGSYSTIFVASGLLLWIHDWTEKRQLPGKSKKAVA